MTNFQFADRILLH